MIHAQILTQRDLHPTNNLHTSPRTSLRVSHSTHYSSAITTVFVIVGICISCLKLLSCTPIPKLLSCIPISTSSRVRVIPADPPVCDRCLRLPKLSVFVRVRRWSLSVSRPLSLRVGPDYDERQEMRSGEQCLHDDCCISNPRRKSVPHTWSMGGEKDAQNVFAYNFVTFT